MEIIQGVLVGISVLASVWFLYNKFFKKTSSKSCDKDSCNC